MLLTINTHKQIGIRSLWVSLQLGIQSQVHQRKNHATKLRANPPGSDAQAIKLCPWQHCCKVQATLQVGFDIFCVIAIILIQDPAHKINYTYFAMAACDIFMVLMRVFLYEGQHARV
jgi:hypothetical protein